MVEDVCMGKSGILELGLAGIGVAPGPLLVVTGSRSEAGCNAKGGSLP